MTLRQMQDNIQFVWSHKKAFLYLQFLVFFLLPLPLYLLPCLQTGNFYVALGAFTVCSMVTIAYYIKKFSFIPFFVVTSLSFGLFFITIGITYEFFLEGALYTGIIYLLDFFSKSTKQAFISSLALPSLDKRHILNTVFCLFVSMSLLL